MLHFQKAKGASRKYAESADKKNPTKQVTGKTKPNKKTTGDKAKATKKKPNASAEIETGSTKDDLALINEAFEDTEMAEVKVEIPDDTGEDKFGDATEEAEEVNGITFNLVLLSVWPFFSLFCVSNTIQHFFFCGICPRHFNILNIHMHMYCTNMQLFVK